MAYCIQNAVECLVNSKNHIFMIGSVKKKKKNVGKIKTKQNTQNYAKPIIFWNN